MRVYASSMTALLTSLLLVLAGCGLDSSGNQTSEGGIGGSGSGPDEVAEGGIGGSGSGTTTGYGSIYINDYRYYQIAEDAIVRLDGELISANTINPTGQGLPLGLVVDFLLDESTNAELTIGTVIEMEASHRIIGPVTSVNPLQVLGQSIQLSVRTVLDGLDPTTLQAGDIVQVAGREDHTGTVRATRLAQPGSVAHWQLIGRVSALSEQGFNIGDQHIDLSTLSPEMQCDEPLANDLKVLVRAEPGLNIDGAISGATLVRCLAEGLQLFERDITESLPATTDGFITNIVLLENDAVLMVDLGSQRVDLSQVVPVLVTTLANLTLGTHLEVDGILNLTTGILEAKRVRLRDELNVLELIAPITALSDGTLTVLGQPVIALPQAEGALYDNLAVGQTVHLLGFVNDATLYAVNTVVVDAQPVSLRGMVTGINEADNILFVAGVPFLFSSANSFSLLGEDGLLVELIIGVCQALLPLLCPATEEPPALSESLIDTVAKLNNSELSGEVLEGGDLLIYPASL